MVLNVFCRGVFGSDRSVQGYKVFHLHSNPQFGGVETAVKPS